MIIHLFCCNLCNLPGAIGQTFYVFDGILMSLTTFCYISLYYFEKQSKMENKIKSDFESEYIQRKIYQSFSKN